MASGQTTNFGLNQWAAEDKVLREDFNADNAKIDAALKTIPKIATGSEEMRQFIEMCFDPQSPMSEKLKQTLLQMMEVDK